MVDRIELGQLMSKALSRVVQAGEPGFDEWAKRVEIPEGLAGEGLRKMYAHHDELGFPGGNALVLRAIIEREPRTLLAFVSELAHSPP